MHTPPIVWVIDAHQWERAYLRAELIARGFDAEGFETTGDALARLRAPGYPLPRLIVVELRGLGPDDDLSALSRAGIPFIALGGASELSEERFRGIGWAKTMRRPFSIGDVADVCRRCI